MDYNMDGKDFTWLITLQELLILLPTPPPNPQTDRSEDREGCTNRNLKRTPSGSRYALTRY